MWVSALCPLQEDVGVLVCGLRPAHIQDLCYLLEGERRSTAGTEQMYPVLTLEDFDFPNG